MRGDREDQIARDVEGEVDRALGRRAEPAERSRAPLGPAAQAPQSAAGADRLAPGRAFTVLGLVLCGQEQQARAVLMQMTPAERTDLRAALVTLLALERRVQMSMDREDSTDGG